MARNTIEVRLDDITRVGEVIDIAITSGANAVHNVRFDLKDRDTAERRRAENGHRRRPRPRKPQQKEWGRRIGRGAHRGTNWLSGSATDADDARGDGAGCASAADPIVAGEIEIRSTVVLTATLK